MAATPKKAPAGELVRARVLVDVPAHGLKAGQVAEAAQAVIDGLVAAGEVDPNPDAVAYALDVGGKVVTLAADNTDDTASA